MANDELNEARRLAIAGWLLASSLEEAERGNGHTLTAGCLCIPHDAPLWLQEGVRENVGTPISEIEVPLQ